MRRGEQADAQSGCAINAFEHRAGRAFAVRAGDVDEAEFFLRIARERGELARVLQPKIRAEQLQAVKKLDGFGVCHSTLGFTQRNQAAKGASKAALVSGVAESFQPTTCQASSELQPRCWKVLAISLLPNLIRRWLKSSTA